MMGKQNWWKEDVIYQIYPRSFKDSNGDGIGDIPGIIEKLDYLQFLGIDVIWLSPVYDSPNDDNGYDIRDYYRIHPEFGTMEDFNTLLEGLHQRGMKLIMDLVVNHTSDEHEWFKASRASKDNPYRDFYIWRNGKEGDPPNNWPSFFQGSAWEHDETTGEYYLHLFSRKQPDLNWENPVVREEIYKIIEFWLEKGIDGFRMDVIPLISKRLDFADAPYDSFGEIVQKVYSNGPRVHEYIHEMYERVLKKYDIMTVGEGPGITKEVGTLYTGKDRGELNMIFQLDHMFLGFGPKGRFDPVPYGLKDLKRIIREWDEAFRDDGWQSVFLDNHDFPRMLSRFGDDLRYREESAKLLAVLVLSLRGTACIYQGSEIGMKNIEFHDISDCRDLETLNFFKAFTKEGMSEADFIAIANQTGRDNVRVPIQWDPSPNAGFTSGTPWIKVNPDYLEVNVKEALERKDSVFYFYQEMLALRKREKTLVYGAFEELPQENGDLFIYRRWNESETLFVLLNMSAEKVPLPDIDLPGAELLLGNYPLADSSTLKPWEARIYKKTSI